MNGFLLCARIDLSTLLGCASCSIASVTLAAPDLSTLSVAWKDDSGSLNVCAVSMPMVAACFEELHQLSKRFSILRGCLDYLSETLKQIKEAWFDIAQVFVRLDFLSADVQSFCVPFQELDAKLASYTRKTSFGCLSADFVELLLFGTPTPELEHFLLQDLGEKGLKKLSSSVDASYSNVQRLVVRYLHAVSQSLNYFLSELSGEASASEKMQVALGIDPEAVRAAQQQAAKFWIKGVELQQVRYFII